MKPRKPLPRSTTPLARSPLKARRKRIAPMSAGRRAIADERREFVARILGTRRWCEWPECNRRATEVDEKRNRSQGSPIVPSKGLTDDDCNALCHEHHRYKTEHPAEAVAMGFGRWGMRYAPNRCAVCPFPLDQHDMQMRAECRKRLPLDDG